jgi:hypothetical protein
MSARSPEQAAKHDLYEVLVDHYDTVDAVTVFRGPPPTSFDGDQVVWVGGIDVDDTPAALAGDTGPTNNSRQTVYVMVDVMRPGDDPAGCDDDALALAHEVRMAIRDAIRNRRPRTHRAIQWFTVGGLRSDGPAPLEAGGWVTTVAVPVQFTSRIR